MTVNEVKARLPRLVGALEDLCGQYTTDDALWMRICRSLNELRAAEETITVMEENPAKAAALYVELLQRDEVGRTGRKATNGPRTLTSKSPNPNAVQVQHYYGFEIWTDSAFHLAVDTNELALDARAASLLEELGPEVETHLTGFVEAPDIESALNKIRSGDWEYTQKL